MCGPRKVANASTKAPPATAAQLNILVGLLVVLIFFVGVLAIGLAFTYFKIVTIEDHVSYVQDQVSTITQFIKPSFEDLEGAALDWTGCSYALITDVGSGNECNENNLDTCVTGQTYISTALHCVVKKATSDADIDNWYLQTGWHVPPDTIRHINDIYYSVPKDVLLFELTDMTWLQQFKYTDAWHSNRLFYPLYINSSASSCPWSDVSKINCYCQYNSKYSANIASYRSQPDEIAINQEFESGDSGCLCKDMENRTNCVAMETGISNNDLKNAIELSTHCEADNTCNNKNNEFTKAVISTSLSKTILTSFFPMVTKLDKYAHGAWTTESKSKSLEYEGSERVIRLLTLPEPMKTALRAYSDYYSARVTTSTDAGPTRLPQK